jgi:hypothetical protein
MTATRQEQTRLAFIEFTRLCRSVAKEREDRRMVDWRRGSPTIGVHTCAERSLRVGNSLINLNRESPSIRPRALLCALIHQPFVEQFVGRSSWCHV